MLIEGLEHLADKVFRLRIRDADFFGADDFVHHPAKCARMQDAITIPLVRISPDRPFRIPFFLVQSMCQKAESFRAAYSSMTAFSPSKYTSIFPLNAGFSLQMLRYYDTIIPQNPMPYNRGQASRGACLGGLLACG